MATSGRQGQETSVRRRVSRVIAAVVGASVALSAATGAAAPPQEPGAASAPQGTAATPEEPETPDEALSVLQPGQYVRVTATGSDITEGRIVAVREGQLVLDRIGITSHLPKEVAIRDVQTVWVRGRGTGTGAITGATVGGMAGAVLGALLACGLSDSPCGSQWLGGAAVGLLTGGVVGIFPGSLIGAALPQWHRAYSAEPATEGATPHLSFAPMGATPSKADWIGSASLHVGYNKALDSIAPKGAAGWRLSLAADHGPISLGLEFGHYGLGGHDAFTWQGDRRHYDESLWHIGPVLSVWLSRGRVRPYALASLGHYEWNAFYPQNLYPPPGVDRAVVADSEVASTYSFLGGSVGGGVRVHTAGALSFGLEGRWHTSLSDSIPQKAFNGPARPLSLLTLNAGATLSW